MEKIAYKLVALYKNTKLCKKFIDEGLKLKEEGYDKEHLESIWDCLDALMDIHSSA